MSGALIDSLFNFPSRQRNRARGASTIDAHFIQTTAGKLRVVDSGGSEPVVLMTPDGPCVIEHYTELIEILSANFRVVCFDMPGIGYSFPSSRYGFGTDESADAVIELMDALSIATAVVAFTCVNGLFAMNLAKRYPDRVSHLVLGQTPSPKSMRQWTERNIPAVLRIPYIGQISGAIGSKQLATRWFDRSLPLTSEHKAWFVQHARHAIDSGGCFCLASLVQGASRSLNEEIFGVDCPTLMIYGDDDHSHKHTDFQSLASTIPDARIVCFNGSGHFPNLERPSDYVAQLRQFVMTAGG